MSKLANKIIYVLLTIHILFCAGLLYWVVIMSGSTDGDTLEHVHSAWLVSHGKIPYVDFFQHHNPLLWYLGAPLVRFYEYSLRAVDAVNILTSTITILTMYYIYRMHKDFLTNKLGGLIAAGFLVLSHDSLFGKDYKPDNFMAAALIIGIYYLLSYIKDKKLYTLVLSFALFFAAFMFTQKAALILVSIGGIILYLLLKKQMKWTDCITAASLPILVYLTFLVFLWYKDSLGFYFKANFELNSRIPAVFDVRRYIHPSAEMFIPILLSLYALAKCVYNGNIYVRIIAVIFIAEYIIRIYYFTPFVYYFAFLHAIAAVLAGVAAVDMINKRKYIVWIFIAYFYALSVYYAKTYSHRITVGDSFKYGAAGLILENTTPCDYVLNGYRIGYNLFNKDVDFVWNLKGQIDVIAATIGLRPLSDLESLVRKYRPKIIFGGNYYDTYREYRGDIGKYPIHWISKHLLEEMYTPLNRDNLYILKPEYQSHDCYYSPRTKSYEYRDKH